MPKIIAISGVKNSGKTTLITRLTRYYSEKGTRVAVIKHDGHDLTAIFRELIPVHTPITELMLLHVFRETEFLFTSREPERQKKSFWQSSPRQISFSWKALRPAATIR